MTIAVGLVVFAVVWGPIAVREALADARRQAGASRPR